MKIRLSLQEKLRDLRDERKLTLQQVANTTGIPLATIARIEGNEDTRAAYQDIATLAKFYDVSADYLFGITDNRQHRNVEIDALSLTDRAIDVLKSKKLNNRLVSELLSHPDFQQLLSALEVCIDKKLLPHMNQMNAIYKLAETTIKENFITDSRDDIRDEVMDFLQNSVIDEDEFLRFRISERFNALVKSLFEAHKKDELPPEQTEVINDMKVLVQGYLEDKKQAGEDKARVALFAKQFGLNLSQLTDEEMAVLDKVVKSGTAYKKGVVRRGGKRK